MPGSPARLHSVHPEACGTYFYMRIKEVNFCAHSHTAWQLENCVPKPCLPLQDCSIAVPACEGRSSLETMVRKWLCS